VGAGLIIDGKIYHGKNGVAAEGGHVTIDYRSDAVCNCGSRGCIEVLASGTAMTRRARGLLREFPASMLAEEPVTPEAIGRAAAAGDLLGVRILDETAEMLGAWLGSMISLLDPDVIVIGGGVAQIGEPLFSRLRRITPGRTINQFASETPIVPAQLGSDAGIIGAAAAVDGI
jgi:glucokinase